MYLFKWKGYKKSDFEKKYVKELNCGSQGIFIFFIKFHKKVNELHIAQIQ